MSPGCRLEESCYLTKQSRLEMTDSVSFAFQNCQQMVGCPTIAGYGCDFPFAENGIIVGAFRCWFTTANGVTDSDGKVADVAFYRETNNQPGLQIGDGGDLLVFKDTNSTDGWKATVPTDKLAPGQYTFYAVAVDNNGALSSRLSKTVTVRNASSSPKPILTDFACTLAMQSVLNEEFDTDVWADELAETIAGSAKSPVTNLVALNASKRQATRR